PAPLPCSTLFPYSTLFRSAGFKSGRGAETSADLLVRLGLPLLVDIGLKPRNLQGGDPDLPVTRVRALIDTEAGCECIDDELARSDRKSTRLNSSHVKIS